MPEYPDISLYLHALAPRVEGRVLESIEVRGPSLLRSVEPRLIEAHGRTVVGLRRIGKRIVFELEDQFFLVIHLMVAGRFQWKKPATALPKRNGLAAFVFDSGCLHLTEVSKRKRASLHLVRGEDALALHDPGGLEVFEIGLAEFDAALRRENHTLKRSLTDPRILSGIGNAYSDEILHRTGLSPLKLSQKLTPEEMERLFHGAREVLEEWRNRLVEEIGDDFPAKVTAFRPEMAVHGKYGQPCPVCAAPVQRIVYASNETNYCVHCQTGGRLLADRGLSRLLKSDWPRSLEELEEKSN